MADKTTSKLEVWKPPPWMHKAEASSTSFLADKKLDHGKLLQKKKKQTKAKKKKKDKDTINTTSTATPSNDLNTNDTIKINIATPTNTINKTITENIEKTVIETKEESESDTDAISDLEDEKNTKSPSPVTKKATEVWKPPTWIHKAKSSDTSFLEPKKLHHGQLLEKEQKTINKEKEKKDDVPKQSVLALIQVQEFEVLFDELYECENSKLRLIHSTSREIDNLRQRIIYLSNETVQTNPSKQSFFQTFLSSFSISFGYEAKEEETFEPIIRAKFSNTEAMEERIQQIKRTKIELVKQTSEELYRLKLIIKYLEQINEMSGKSGRFGFAEQSRRDILFELVAALVITGVVLSI